MSEDLDETINIRRNVPVNPVENSNQPVTKPNVSDYPSETIGLPSDGIFYDQNSPLSKGLVDVKYMTAKEEDILSSQNLIKKGIVLEKLLESLIVTPGVKVKDLLIGDKNALFVAARRLAYGDDYGPLNVICNKCGEENNTTFNLSTVKNKDFDASKYTRGSNVFEYVLPTSKKVVKFKLMTHADEQIIDQEIESLKKISKNGPSKEVTTRLKRMILSIDGNDDRQFINNFIDNNLLSRDSLALRNYAREITPDIDLAFDFECQHCGEGERRDIPMTVSFFWPNT